jgi:hypothetical protein
MTRIGVHDRGLLYVGTPTLVAIQPSRFRYSGRPADRQLVAKRTSVSSPAASRPEAVFKEEIVKSWMQLPLFNDQPADSNLTIRFPALTGR